MKSIDFSKGARGKYAKENLRVVGDNKEKSSWAICITSEGKNLIPLKLYEVKIHQNPSEVEVVDETDEAVIYPLNYFLLINLLKNEAELLSKVSLSI